MNDATRGMAASIRELAGEIDPESGLPEELFLLVSSITPLINVDLLVRDECGRTLLTWRSDRFHGPGWHVPGGIIRYKETMADRICRVADRELGAMIKFDESPILIYESIIPGRRERGHFISLLYRCSLTSDPDLGRRHSDGVPLPGQWRWHDRCPDNLIQEQQAYAPFVG